MALAQQRVLSIYAMANNGWEIKVWDNSMLRQKFFYAVIMLELLYIGMEWKVQHGHAHMS
jgi:hypothetical protein